MSYNKNMYFCYSHKIYVIGEFLRERVVIMKVNFYESQREYEEKKTRIDKLYKKL
jgi:hypothetical protein